jgi:hypothetical protein
MTTGCVLSYGGTSVILTNMNVIITHRFSNPVIIIPTPITTSLKIGDNVIGINIGLVRNSFDISLTLTDGPGTFNFTTPSTTYEKIMYMANFTKNVKTLTLNGQQFQGHIENVNVTWEPGFKNLSERASFIFTLGKDIKMDSN